MSNQMWRRKRGQDPEKEMVAIYAKGVAVEAMDAGKKKQLCQMVVTDWEEESRVAAAHFMVELAKKIASKTLTTKAEWELEKQKKLQELMGKQKVNVVKRPAAGEAAGACRKPAAEEAPRTPPPRKQRRALSPKKVEPTETEVESENGSSSSIPALEPLPGYF